MKNLSNSLSAKYLTPPEARSQARQHGNEKVNTDDVGYLGNQFVAVGVYYCSAIDQFGHFEDGITDPITDGAGRTWRLVSTDYLQWMAGMIQRAFDQVTTTDLDLGAAILKFYRVRDRLEQEIEKHELASKSDPENVRWQDIGRDSAGPQFTGTVPAIDSGASQRGHGASVERGSEGRLAENAERGQCSGVESCPAGGLQEPGGPGAAVAGGGVVVGREPGDESEADDAELAAMVAA